MDSIIGYVLLAIIETASGDPIELATTQSLDLVQCMNQGEALQNVREYECVPVENHTDW